MLSVSNVTKKFGSIVAVNDVSFQVEDGEFVLLVGPSGAGKTTILKLLASQFPPTNGEIVLDGTPVHKLKKNQIPSYRRSIGIVFQDFRLLPTMTIAENITLPLAVHKVDRKEWATRVMHVASLVGIADRLNLFPSQLSGGELQRAAIARALITNPKIILADEPTGNLDWKTASDIVNLLNKINKEGKTIIVSTHNQEIIKSHEGRVISIESGSVVVDEPRHKNKKHHERN